MGFTHNNQIQLAERGEINSLIFTQAEKNKTQKSFKTKLQGKKNPARRERQGKKEDEETRRKTEKEVRAKCGPRPRNGGNCR